MSELDEQTKEPPEPAIPAQRGLAPAHEYPGKSFRRFHHHTLSDVTSASSDSSPTTTISTVDDSSATEPSPGSSPESPPPATFVGGTLRPHSSDESRPYFELQKQPPPRKGRNLKNLAVNTSRNPGRAASTSSLPLPPVEPISTTSITSPNFVKPPTPSKRKPSNLGLTLLTPGSSKAPPQEIKLAIPPTPAFGRPGTLRHFQSSPSLPLVPGFSPKTQVVPSLARIHTTLETIFSPMEQQQKTVEEEEQQNFDVPLSKEEKPEAYPDGPICVYDPHIDLYLEPTAEQAKEYDVIFNVASEVRNPFTEQIHIIPEEPDIRIDGGGGIQYAPKRDRLPAPKESRSTRESSPTTPKATPLSTEFPNDGKIDSDKAPEYIHVQWEHNSDIVPDLLRLVKLIDEKVLQRKRVLVHCQCGVSRSASLVVAYGMYKDPSLSVQEAYDAVKKRSKWIGPNMNLIMQLQEFRSSLMNGGILRDNRGLTPITPSSAITDWRGPFSRNPTDHMVPMSAGVAPLTKAQTAESLPSISPGPSSAPSNLTAGQRPRAISAVKPATAYVDPSGKVVPIVPTLNIVEPGKAHSERQDSKVDQTREDSDSATPTEAKTSPQSADFAMTPLQPSPDVDPADTFGVMSPSTTEFATSPFDRSTLLAQLGMGSVRQAEEVPRRSASLRSRPKEQRSDEAASSTSKATPRLRGKLSTPSIRQQKELQSLQTKISASLPHRSAQHFVMDGIDEALMSPRATEFTQNPFAAALTPPPTDPTTEGKTSPSTDSDPRSPAQEGLSPITRSILDVL